MSLSSSLLREAGGEVEGCGGGGDMTSRPGVRVPQLDPGLVSPFRNLNRRSGLMSGSSYLPDLTDHVISDHVTCWSPLSLRSSCPWC